MDVNFLFSLGGEAALETQIRDCRTRKQEHVRVSVSSEFTRDTLPQSILTLCVASLGGTLRR